MRNPPKTPEELEIVLFTAAAVPFCLYPFFARPFGPPLISRESFCGHRANTQIRCQTFPPLNVFLDVFPADDDMANCGLNNAITDWMALRRQSSRLFWRTIGRE